MQNIPNIRGDINNKCIDRIKEKRRHLLNVDEEVFSHFRQSAIPLQTQQAFCLDLAKNEISLLPALSSGIWLDIKYQQL